LGLEVVGERAVGDGVVALEGVYCTLKIATASFFSAAVNGLTEAYKVRNKEQAAG
jgi:hypothetical protein